MTREEVVELVRKNHKSGFVCSAPRVQEVWDAIPTFLAHQTKLERDLDQAFRCAENYEGLFRDELKANKDLKWKVFKLENQRDVFMALSLGFGLAIFLSWLVK